MENLELIEALGFITSFWVSFLSGVVTGLIGNFVYDWIRLKQRGSKPYLTTTSKDGIVTFEGTVTQSDTNQRYISSLWNNLTISKVSDQE